MSTNQPPAPVGGTKLQDEFVYDALFHGKMIQRTRTVYEELPMADKLGFALIEIIEERYPGVDANYRVRRWMEHLKSISSPPTSAQKARD